MQKQLSCYLLLLSVMLSSNGQIKCDTFNLITDFKANTFNIHINTDLPDDAIIMLNVGRSYWETENDAEYALEYYSSKNTVGEWRNLHEIPISNSKWQRDLESKQKDLAPLGLGFDVARISDSISIRAVIPINQTNKGFGDRNENLTGQKVIENGLRVVKDEVNFYSPLKDLSNKQSPYADPLALEVGKSYVVSKETPVVPKIETATPLQDIQKIKYVPASGIIKIIGLTEKNDNPWYRVELLTNQGKRNGRGWINSKSLQYQEIKIKQ